MKKIVMMAVALMVVAIILPIAIGLIADAGNTSITWTSYPYSNSTSVERTDLLSDLADPSIITLLTILLPLIAVIVVVLYFLPKRK